MILKQMTTKSAGLFCAAVLAALVLCGSPAGKLDTEAAGPLSFELGGSTSESKPEINFDYVASDLANWRAVYLPVLEAKGTLGSRGKLPERQSRNLDVTDAIEDIYQNLTDTIRGSSVLKTEKALMLYDVLNGNYSRKAVEALLDHGYFTDYYGDLHKAGLVEAGYHLPAKSYSIDVLNEKVSVPSDDGESTTYRMLKTDSPYLDTEQLLTVARSTRDKKTIRTLERKAASFEEDFIPKYKN